MKKVIVVLLCAVLMTSSTPVVSYAQVDKSKVVEVIDKGDISVTEPTDTALQSAILAVKEKITIPKEYSKFNYYFFDSNDYSKAAWTFSWSNPDNGAIITVTCDVDKHITNYSKSNYSTEGKGIAKYLKSELESVAEKFIKEVAPETNGHLKPVNSEYTYIYSGDYTYTYERVENNIVLPDNSVTVNVNSITGEVTWANINWLYNASLPTVDTKLSKEDATALIKKNMKMKLIYRSNYIYTYDKFTNSSTKEAFLVYEPTKNYIAVDAKTGKIYDTKNEWITTNEAAKDASTSYNTSDMVRGDGTGTSINLSEDEIKQIEELKNLISKSKAIKLITENKSLYKDNHLTKATADLNKTEDENGKTTYVWYINLSDPRKVTKDDNYRGYAYASIDAQTGKILSYNASMKSNYDAAKDKWNSVKIKYNKKQSRTILEKFLKSEANIYFASSVLSSTTDDYVINYKNDAPVYGGYAYTYNRTNNGIEYPENYLYGSVDGVTGKIYSFGSYWNNNVNFQSSSNIITADQAMDYYLGKDGYGLKYEINSTTTYSDTTGNYSTVNEIRLVYRPDLNPPFISPYTGEQLNNDGSVYTTMVPYVYKDITNTEANRNILLLADMNIGFDGENFLPNQNITAGEIETLLNKVGYGYNKIDNGANDPITREKLAQLFVNWLGLEKMSKLKVYSTGYQDENKINSEYLGAVALAKGFGIITGDSANMFNPQSYVTRLDAVNMIMNYINAQRSGVLY